MGGLAPGGLPNFRIVWGGDPLVVIGGKWRDYDPNTKQLVREVVEYRQVPKYPLYLERWVFEMWKEPECTREQWAERTYQFIDGQLMECAGPYPAEGFYVDIKVLQTSKGGFVPLTSTICDAVVVSAQKSKEFSVQQRVAARRARFEEEEKAKDNRLMARIKELGQAEMALVPHIVVPSSFEKEKISE